MKATIISIITLCTIMAIVSPAQLTGYTFSTYQSASGFAVELPLWDKAEMVRQGSLELICAHSKNIFIKIIKVKTAQKDIKHYMTWKIWDTDPNAHFIIKKTIEDGGIIVTTYRNGMTSLRRIRIVHHDEYSYIIICSAPEKNFYAYEAYFNRVFASFTVR